MRMKPAMTTEDVRRIVAAARKKCAALERPATIAVVDEAGQLLYLERPDTVDGNSVDVAVMKARTAAFRQRPTSAFADRVRDRPGFLAMPNFLGVEGGIPLIYRGSCVGGIAVSGIDSDDEPVAQAGADALDG